MDLIVIISNLRTMTIFPIQNIVRKFISVVLNRTKTEKRNGRFFQRNAIMIFLVIFGAPKNQFLD